MPVTREPIILEQELRDFCLAHKMTIGVAESCTGGAFAARITEVAGASLYFMGSIVSYTNLIKTRVLGVPEILLERYGAVSVPVVLEMLSGALSKLSCDVAVAITGIAGPNGSTRDTPVGTIFIAIGGKNLNPEVIELHLEGDRVAIIQQTVDQALKQLILKLSNNL